MSNYLFRAAFETVCDVHQVQVIKEDPPPRECEVTISAALAQILCKICAQVLNLFKSTIELNIDFGHKFDFIGQLYQELGSITLFNDMVSFYLPQIRVFC